jgi:hypothetical protein
MQTPMTEDYPYWLCFDCGKKYGRGLSDDGVCAVHEGTCGLCGKAAPVMQTSDFGHLKPGWEQFKKGVQ